MSCIGIACIVAAQLTAADIGYSNNMPNTAYSYDNKPRDVSRFYKDEQLNVMFEGYVILNTKTKISFGFNNGFKTDKMHTSNRYTLGVDQAMQISERSYITIGATVSSGNKTTHTPCVDSDGIRYYCPNLTLWSTHEDPTYENTYQTRFSYTYRF